MTVRDLGKALGGAVLKRLGRAASRFQEETPLPVDILESDDQYLVVFDAPGVTSSDIQVSYHGHTVTVRIDRFREFREGYEMRFPGRGLQLDGDAELPEDAVVDVESARAELKDNGTLYVRLPKEESAGEEAETVEAGTEAEETAVTEQTEAEPLEDEETDTGASEDEAESEESEGETKSKSRSESESESADDSGSESADESESRGSAD